MGDSLHLSPTSLNARDLGGSVHCLPSSRPIDIYRGLQQGHIDRSLLAPNLNDYFSPQAVSDFQASLGAAGRAAQLPPGCTIRCAVA